MYVHLKCIMALMRYFPNAPDGNIYTIMELKSLYFNMMPLAFQMHFKAVGKMLNTTEWPALVHFFATIHAADEQKKQMDKQQKKLKTKGKHKTGKSDAQNKSKTSKKNKSSGGAKKDCPFHEGMHSWWQCFGNKHGPNYKPDYKLPLATFNKKNQGHDSDGHAIETKNEDVIGVIETLVSSFEMEVDKLLKEMEETQLKE